MQRQIDTKVLIYQNTENVDECLYFINRMGYGARAPKDFYIDRDNSYPYCVIHYVASGSVKVKYQSKEYVVKQGETFILSARESHIYKNNSKNKLKLIWVEFGGNNSKQIIDKVISYNSPIIDNRNSIRVLNSMNRLFDLVNKYKDKQVNQYLLSKDLYSFLLMLLTMQKQKAYNNISKENIAAMLEILKYIQNNLNKKISIKLLAEKSHFSYVYFCKIFYSFTGTTPAKYILNVRINTAKNLLVKTDKSIEYIGDILGFCNSSHFIRCFKKIEGLTPSEYRKQNIYFYIN